MNNQSVNANVFFAIVIATAIIGVVVLSFEPTIVANGRVWVTDPMRNAPIAASESGENAYIVWWTNRTGNDEVMFRASADGGVTFGDKINLSNSTDADSIDAEVETVGDNVVIVTWWDWRNQTSTNTTGTEAPATTAAATTTMMSIPGGGEAEPVARISTDSGQTFGPIWNLATNGTIGEVGG
jgi:hypothetical protein